MDGTFTYMKHIILLVSILCAICTIQSARSEPTADQVRIARRIANLMATGEFGSVREYFDDTLKQSLSTRQMEQAWNALISQTGEFDRVVKTAGATTQGFDVVEVLCATRQGGLVVRTVFDPGLDRLNGLWVAPAQVSAPHHREETPTKTPSFPE